MDVDRISQIFGSFSRRRESQGTSSPRQKRNRLGFSPNLTRKRDVTFRTQTTDDSNIICPICNNRFTDPKILPCLHTFCLNCLEDMEKNLESEKVSDAEENQNSATFQSVGSNIGSNSESVTKKTLICPACDAEVSVPRGGMRLLRPNYLIQRQVETAKSLRNTKRTFCSGCTSNAMAFSHCTDCNLDLCRQCESNHIEQHAFHEICDIPEMLDQNGPMTIESQVMCPIHDAAMNLFCATCLEVVCQDCIPVAHKSHSYDDIGNVAKIHIVNLRIAANKTNGIVEKAAVSANQLATCLKDVETECTKVQSEVEKFIEVYIKSIEDHKNSLLQQIEEVRQDRIQHLTIQKAIFQKKICDARTTEDFVDHLLNYGSDVEILSLLKPVMRKVEACETSEEQEIKCSTSLQFLPEESVKSSDNVFSLQGVLTTQKISAQHSCIKSIEDLQNLRVGKKVEVILETRDNKNHPLERGGEYVQVEIRHREAGVSRSLVVKVVDKKNGSYKITFVPDVAGKLLFLLKVNGEHIKGSPFPIMVRNLKPHLGIFHCCTFCSTGGSKNTACGCMSRMPGGFEGCGHGHEGHPGRRHWSCCGNVSEHSECERPSLSPRM